VDLRGIEPLTSPCHGGVFPIELQARAGGDSIRYGFERLAIPSYEETSVEMRGVEPLTEPCESSVFPTIPHPHLVDPAGIKPASLGCKPSVSSLALRAQNLAYSVGIEPTLTTVNSRSHSPVTLGVHSEPPVGIESTTAALQVRCSTTELRGQKEGDASTIRACALVLGRFHKPCQAKGDGSPFLRTSGRGLRATSVGPHTL
jgi:hypothetical protein